MDIYSVLYVESDDDVREDILKYLNKLFKIIYSVDNGEEAFEIYKKREPDIIITAIEISGVNGLDLICKIREVDRNIPIIVTSSYTAKEYLLKAIELHLVKYLVKPIDNAELLEALELSVRSISADTVVNLGSDYRYDITNQMLRYKNEIVPIRISHKLLLEILIANKYRAVTYVELENYIWGYNRMSEAALRSLIYDLRAIIGKNIIQNISKIGYRISL